MSQLLVTDIFRFASITCLIALFPSLPVLAQQAEQQADQQANQQVTPQDNQPTWKNPPDPIASMLDVEPLPRTLISPDNQWMIELVRPALPPIEQLAEPVVAIAGRKINPDTWGPSREFAYIGMRIRALAPDSPARTIALPANPRIRNLRWSHDSRHLAFTLTRDTAPNNTGIELWVLDVATAQARQLTPPRLSAVNGSPCDWLPGSQGLVCTTRRENVGTPPEPSPIPTGPVIESTAGRVAPARTYTNLLQNAHNEALLDYYFTAQPVQVSLSGEITPLGEAGLIRNLLPSPDGKWLLRSTYHRPFSYQVPLYRFPVRYEVLDRNARVVHTVADLDLADNIPIVRDSVRLGRRIISWRADQPATLFWVEALDGGDAGKSASFRDGLWSLPAPFTAEPELLWRSQFRFAGVTWGKDNLALVSERWFKSRQTRRWQINPTNPETSPRLIEERDYQDAYASIGNPVTKPGPYGWSTLHLEGDRGDETMYLDGYGASPEGVFPFLDRYRFADGSTERLWQAEGENYTYLDRILDAEATQILIRRQSPSQPSNLYRLDRQRNNEAALTDYADPLAWYANTQKELVQYTRADGLPLNATLYLPPNYDPKRDGPLPTLLWVYPREFKSREAAGQVTKSAYRFTRPQMDSVLFLLTQGYAVLHSPTMPIIGEGEQKPNDTYIEQLVTSAEAAVDYLVARGVSDRNRLAISGHSYGAFTAANLLAHSDLFQAGIARSGAYNRSLTPFGFQGEDRTFWDAPETYTQMSPFFAADQINEPLLLIHGADDSNSGTFPMQTERLYEAIRGLGGTARYVSLPMEGHSYRSREAVGHVLWEMVQWLDQHVKGAGEQ